MKTSNRIKFTLFSGLILACGLLGAAITAQARTAAVSDAPAVLDHMLLLPDGTVLGAQNNGSNWYRLTPSRFGGYSGGTWTNIAPMHETRSSFSSAVLKDGRLFVAGSSSSNGLTGWASAEIYNPSNNTWTVVSAPASVLDPTKVSPNTGTSQGIYDAECKVLPDGRVFLLPRAPMTANGTLIFDPVANSWSAGPPTLRYAGEAGAVKLPDGSALIIDRATNLTERFLPALNLWTNDSSSPAIWASLGAFAAEGPGFLLPDGRAIFFGGTGEVALYTPSGGNSPGTWTASVYPAGQATAEGPGAMMVDGNILISASPNPIKITSPAKGQGQGTPSLEIVSQTTFYEYNYSSATFINTGLSNTVNCSQNMMLDLPDGSVLLGVIGAEGTGQLIDYFPSGAPLSAGKPSITGLTTNVDGSLHFTGILFNGISEGAAYGAQHQMATDFPLVRFTSASGEVRYGRTYNWSTAGVMTGGAIVSTDCQPPPGWSGSDLVQMVANGMASDPTVISPIVTNINDAGAGSLREVIATSGSGSAIRFATNLSGQTITLATGALMVTNNVTIDASALVGGIQINGNHDSAVFSVGAGATVTLNALTFTNGYVPGGSGGAIVNSGSLTLNNCTLAGNFAGWGGAIENYGTCDLANCTLIANYAQNYGGAIDNVGGALTLLQCTVCSNATTGLGGGVDNDDGSVSVANCIVAFNGGQDIYTWNNGATYVEGTNIVTSPVIATPPANVFYYGAELVTDPLLSPLANNGGSTPTMLPEPGSPAIDAADPASDGGLTTDQRGLARVVGPAPDIGAVEFQDAAPLVTNTADSGFGSLRYVSAYSPLGSIITFATNLSGRTITVSNGQINLYQGHTIDASDLPGGVSLNGNHNSRIFNVAGGASVTLNSLTFTNGYEPSGLGGAIYDQGALTLNNCTLAGNSAGWGGAIENYAACALVNCTLTGNYAQNYGGAIDNVAGTLTLLQCTVCSNATSGLGGGVDNYDYGSVSLANCVVALNTGQDIYTWSNSATYVEGTNIVTSPLTAIPPSYVFDFGAALLTDPMLGQLANNGGPTPTMLPQFGSPAIDAADPSIAAGLTTDQRGYPRVAGPEPDIGAVEFQDAPPLVTATADSGPGSLRYVSTYSPVGSTITFATNLSGQTITLTNGEIDLYQSHTIDGSALPQGISLSGNGSNRIFGIIGQAATLNSLTLTNGAEPGNSGGAILDEASLILNGCTLVGNYAQFAGAIVNYGNCSLVNCTLTGNSAQYNGGAIDNVGSGATLDVTQCTIWGNSAGDAGGGIDNYQAQLNVANSIIANNGTDINNWENSYASIYGDNIFYDIVPDGIFTVAGTFMVVDPMLGPLANNGGPTPTMLPQPGSPAIDNGVTSFAAGINYDQRGPGFPRVVGAAVDIGAVEVRVIIAPGPSQLIGETSTNGIFGFSFTNISDANFTVLATTNLALPLNTWSNLGPAVEFPANSGQYQFTDPQATNYALRFYRVRSP